MAKYKPNQITFRIDVLTPATLPSKRFAEYLLNLTALLGSEESVHFERLSRGSARIIQFADKSALQAIRGRMLAAAGGTPMVPNDISQAYQRLNLQLAEDQAVGDLRIGRERILAFPGRKLEAEQTIGPIAQNEYLDGQLVRVGGLDETVPVYLREGPNVYYCTANVETARRLGPYLYGQTVRLFGTAYWLRDGKGQWALQKFLVENFAPLEDAPISIAVADLRSIPKDGWDDTAADEIRLKEG